MPSSREHVGLRRRLSSALLRETGDFRPALDEAVIGERLCCSFFALADGVQPIGELAGRLRARAELGDQIGGALSPPAPSARMS
jgi:hypothetical protein